MVKPERKAKIEKDISCIAEKIDCIKPSHVGTQTKLIFNMNMMYEKGRDSSPADKEYWQERGWIGKARSWKNESCQSRQTDNQRF